MATAEGDRTRTAELLWGPRERPSRGPKPGLTRDAIVQAAVGVADAEGLAAVSMQRVAAQVGFTTMALYRYVPGKNELVALMVDAAVGAPPDLDAVPGGWRPKLAEWARLTWHGFQAHPWLLPAALNNLMGPNQLGWLERAVAAMAGSGLAGAELVEAVLTVNGHVRSLASVLTDRTAGTDTMSGEEWAELILTLLRQHADRFPAINAAIADGAFAPSGEDPLDFGLQRVLDGIEVLIARRSG